MPAVLAAESGKAVYQYEKSSENQLGKEKCKVKRAVSCAVRARRKAFGT